MHSSHLNVSWKIQQSYKLVSFICNHSRTAHSCEICDLPSVPSAAQTNEVSQWTMQRHKRHVRQEFKENFRIIHPIFWGHWVKICGVTNSTIMKWKWLFIIGCECKSLISTMTEFLKFCQYRKNSSMFLGIHWKIMILNLNKWATFNTVLTSITFISRLNALDYTKLRG